MAKTPIALLYDHVGSRFMKYIQDGTESLLGVASKLRNVAGTIVNPSTEDTLLGVKANQESAVNAGNSTTTPLGASGVFTGTSADCLGYAGISVVIHADQVSAASGVKLQFSHDNSEWLDHIVDDFVPTVHSVRRFRVPVFARYFRVKYTNGTVAQTHFDIQTILHRNLLADSVRVAKHSDDGYLDFLRLTTGLGAKVSLHNPDGYAIGHEAGSPVFVTPTAPSDREFLSKYAIAGDTPARLETVNSQPYNIGTLTLTLTVNGTSDNCTFPAKAATKGIVFSGQNPQLNNPDEERLKLRIDGGAETEVKIGKNLGDPYVIAANLQTQIRAIVPNGSGVIVEYSPTDYPGRYVIRSGTTGSSSSVWIKKDDHLDKDLKLATAWSGTQRDGLNANYYYADEAAEVLAGDTSGVLFSSSGGKVQMETIALGASASLQVGAGGANTAFGFPTTIVYGTTGTQSNNLNVNGSIANVRYSITADSSYTFNISKIVFLLRQDDIQLREFGGIAQLANGVQLETRTAGGAPRTWFTAKTNSELVAASDTWDLIDDAYAAGGKDLFISKIVFQNPVVLRPSSLEQISIVVRDDLSAIPSFQVRAEGWLEIE